MVFSQLSGGHAPGATHKPHVTSHSHKSTAARALTLTPAPSLFDPPPRKPHDRTPGISHSTLGVPSTTDRAHAAAGVGIPQLEGRSPGHRVPLHSVRRLGPMELARMGYVELSPVESDEGQSQVTEGTADSEVTASAAQSQVTTGAAQSLVTGGAAQAQVTAGASQSQVMAAATHALPSAGACTVTGMAAEDEGSTSAAGAPLRATCASSTVTEEPRGEGGVIQQDSGHAHTATVTHGHPTAVNAVTHGHPTAVTTVTHALLESRSSSGSLGSSREFVVGRTVVYRPILRTHSACSQAGTSRSQAGQSQGGPAPPEGRRKLYKSSSWTGSRGVPQQKSGTPEAPRSGSTSPGGPSGMQQESGVLPLEGGTPSEGTCGAPLQETAAGASAAGQSSGASMTGLGSSGAPHSSLGDVSHSSSSNAPQPSGGVPQSSGTRQSSQHRPGASGVLPPSAAPLSSLIGGTPRASPEAGATLRPTEYGTGAGGRLVLEGQAGNVSEHECQAGILTEARATAQAPRRAEGKKGVAGSGKPGERAEKKKGKQREEGEEEEENERADVGTAKGKGRAKQRGKENSQWEETGGAKVKVKGKGKREQDPVLKEEKEARIARTADRTASKSPGKGERGVSKSLGKGEKGASQSPGKGERGASKSQKKGRSKAEKEGSKTEEEDSALLGLTPTEVGEREATVHGPGVGDGLAVVDAATLWPAVVGTSDAWAPSALGLATRPQVTGFGFRSWEEDERVSTVGLLVFWAGFCVAACICEAERQRMEAELVREKDSAAFLAHVTALEWTKKQESERERILAATDNVFFLSCTPPGGAQLSEDETGEEGEEEGEGLNDSSDDGYGTNLRGGRRARGPSDSAGAMIRCSSTDIAKKQRLGSPQLAGAPSSYRARGIGYTEGEPSLVGLGRRLRSGSDPVGEGPVTVGEGRVTVAGEQSGSKALVTPPEELQEYAVGLEQELDKAYGDLDSAIAELDRTKAEMDQLMGELEVCRAGVEDLDLMRHKVKMLRVCLEIVSRAEKKAAMAAEGAKEELKKTQAAVTETAHEANKLRLKNSDIRNALGVIVAHHASRSPKASTAIPESVDQ